MPADEVRERRFDDECHAAFPTAVGQPLEALQTITKPRLHILIAAGEVARMHDDQPAAELPERGGGRADRGYRALSPDLIRSGQIKLSAERRMNRHGFESGGRKRSTERDDL